MTDLNHRHALPPGHELQDYRLLQVLGSGGFGITYLAQDVLLDRRVAIKEYLPNELAVREGTQVHPKSTDDRDDYRWGLARFLDEARTLARFKHRNVVRLQRYFEDNGTAYLVMDYEDGASLGQLLEEHGTFSEPHLRRVLMPVVDGLRAVHAAGFLHRDIKPSNIYVRRTDESPVLLDFGAARQALGHRSRSLTGIITAGYSPPEQYERDGNQGPWSDIYALSALCYRASTGQAPVDVLDRQREVFRHRRPDPLPKLADDPPPGYSRSFAEAVDWGLQLSETDRPQTLDAWNAKLGAGDESPERSTDATERQAKPAPVLRPTSTARKWPIAVSVIAIAVVGIAVVQSMERDALPTIEPGSTKSSEGHHEVAAPAELEVTKAVGADVPQDDVESAEPNPDAIMHEDAGTQADRPSAVERTSTETATRDEDDGSLPELEATNESEGAPQHDIGDTDGESRGGVAEAHGRRAAPPTVEPTPAETTPRDEHAGTSSDSSSLLTLQREADAGDAESQYRLGTLYTSGGEAPQDYGEAATWFRKAAEQGHADAQYRLGELYRVGDGVPADYDLASAWYRKAARQGHAMAQYMVGLFYSPLDRAESAAWFRKAAEQGFDLGQWFLARAYEQGDGVPQDHSEAAAWYRKAADQGLASGQLKLGDMYAEGRGVPRDHAESIIWYRKAAEKLSASAQFGVGLMYTGRLINMQDEIVKSPNYEFSVRDDVRAYAWFNLSSSRGHAKARVERDRLGERMGRVQITEAQALSRQLDPGIPHQ